MAGLLDFLGLQSGGGGLLGLGGNPLFDSFGGNQGMVLSGLGLAGGATPAEGFKNMLPALQQAYEQQSAQKAGMALLGSLPGGGVPQQQPSAAPSMSRPPMMQIAPTSNMPRGIRNNNPLNIEAGPFTQGQPGFSGSDGRFAQFAQPQQGIDAAGKLLDTYSNKYGLNTVNGIISRWAPAGENDPRGYAASVAGRMGVDPDQPLTPEQRPALIAAMGQFENGRPIQMGAPSQAMGFGGAPDRPDARGVYSADAVMLPQQADQAALPPNSAPAQGYAIPGGAQPAGPRGVAAAPMAPPAGSPMTNQPGSGLTLVDSPALQGMPDTVRRAIPLMLQSKTMAPQAMTLIQKYINPDQWQMWRDSMGNVFTRNSATGESKPLLTPTPDMMNANASGMKSPFEYQAATQFSGSAAKNTELTPEQKNAAASPNPTTGAGMTPAQYEGDKAQSVELAKNWVKKYETTVDAGTAARQALPQLALAKNIVQTDPNFYSGIGDNYNLALKKIWVAAGGDPNTAASQELVGKVLSGQIVSGLRTAFGGLGQVRVAELNALQNSLASKSNTPQALAALITMSEKTQQRAADIADIAQQYNNGSGKLDAGFDRAVAEYDRSHPMFKSEEIADYKKIAEGPAAKAQPANPYEAEMRRRKLLP